MSNSGRLVCVQGCDGVRWKSINCQGTAVLFPSLFLLEIEKSMFCSIMLTCCTFVFLFQLEGLKVREAAGVFFIFVGNSKNGLVKLIVAKLLKRHGGRDRRKHRDVCRETWAELLITSFFPYFKWVGEINQIQFQSILHRMLLWITSTYPVWQESQGGASSEQTPWVY